MKHLIEVEEALELIEHNIQKNAIVKKPLTEVLNLVLAEDIVSPINMPPFDQSAMDGFAVRVGDTHTFTLVGEVKAGDEEEPSLQAGEAVRIFTGAPVPETADRVVRQEDCEIGEFLKCNPLPHEKANIRPEGEQIKIGDIALRKGQVLNTPAIGYLSGLGISEVEVYASPTIVILVTGNELVGPGEPLKRGQIYESNAVMLQCALRERNISASVYFVKDNYEDTEKMVSDLLASSDLLLCSGGISVGDYDFVGKALKANGVNEVFYKVKQKPGKPLFFGKTKGCSVFALPGNPAAALTCFYVYVSKAIDIMLGHINRGKARVTKLLVDDYARKSGRAEFLKAAICGEEVKVLEYQSSAMLNSFSKSNALVYIPIDKAGFTKGEEVECIVL